MIILVTAVLVFAGLVLDGGLALAAKMRALGDAQEAARAGAQHIDLTRYRQDGSLFLLPEEAVASAQAYLVAVGDTGTVSVSGNSVSVSVTITQPTQLLSLIGMGSITVIGTGRAQPEHGVDAPES